MESTRFQFLKHMMVPSSNTLCGGEEAHKYYTENIVKLCKYVKVVNHTPLPILRYPFANWDDYARTFISVKSSSLKWTNNVMGGLVKTPEYILAKNKYMCELFERIIGNCATLAIQPNDPEMQMCVTKDLDYCMEDIEDVCTLIEDLINELDEFNKSLQKQAEQLKQLANTALKEEKVDREKIAQLESNLKAVNTEIDHLTNEIIGLTAGHSICLAVGAGLIFAGPFGIVATVFMVIAAASLIGAIGTDSIKLQGLQKKMNELTDSMNGYTIDAAALKTIAQNFSDLATQADDLKKNLHYIYDMWNALLKDIKAIADETEKAIQDNEIPQWAEVGKDMQAGFELWKQFIDKVNILSLEDLNGNTALLELGMTQQEVEAALDKGSKMNLMDYLTA